MRIGDLLDELRRALPACSLCAYIDLDVQLVLSVSAAKKPRQEQLDALAQLAASLLAPKEAPALDRCVSHDAAPMLSLFLADRSLFLMRAPADPSEVIFCQCAPGVDVQSVASGAQLALSWIGDAA